jgi:hypothetical protein
MSIVISDGTGSGKLTGVTSNNRIKAAAVSYTGLEAGSIGFNGYYVDTGVVTLTTAGESAVIYVKNTHNTLLLQLSTILYSFGNSNVVGDIIVKSYINSIGGTIISAGSAPSVSNRNLGSTVPAQISAFVGGEGKTITGGTLGLSRIYSTPRTDLVSPGVILPVGANLTTTVQPPTGNTSIKVGVAYVIQFLDVNEI